LEKHKFQEFSPLHKSLYVAQTAAAKACQLALNDFLMIRQLANRQQGLPIAVPRSAHLRYSENPREVSVVAAQTKRRCSDTVRVLMLASPRGRPIRVRYFSQIRNDTSPHHSSQCRTSNIYFLAKPQQNSERRSTS
jgi:hypothetical protein